MENKIKGTVTQGKVPDSHVEKINSMNEVVEMMRRMAAEAGFEEFIFLGSVKDESNKGLNVIVSVGPDKSLDMNDTKCAARRVALLAYAMQGNEYFEKLFRFSVVAFDKFKDSIKINYTVKSGGE